MKTALSANTTFYVSEPGSNSNNGLSSAAPWPLSSCWSNLRDQYDLAGHVATFQLVIPATGYFSIGCTAYGAIGGACGPSSVVFNGDLAVPGNYLVAPSIGTPFVSAFGSAFTLQNLDVDGHIANGDCVVVGQGGMIAISAPGQQMYFRDADASGGNHMTVAQGGVLNVNGNYTIRGGGQAHILAGDGGIVYYNTNGVPGIISVTLQNNKTFAAAFMLAVNCGVINVQSIAWLGTAQGPRYLAKSNGVITTFGGGANYFPGSAAGSVNTGGQYL